MSHFLKLASIHRKTRQRETSKQKRQGGEGEEDNKGLPLPESRPFSPRTKGNTSNLQKKMQQVNNKQSNKTGKKNRKKKGKKPNENVLCTQKNKKSHD